MSKEKAVDYFDRHKSSNECHITSDGRVFHTIGSAQGFAQGLKDNNVKSFTRTELNPENIAVVDSEELTGDVDTGQKEARFKTRVDRLILLGFERKGDLFISVDLGTEIEASVVLEISDEDFQTSITPVKYLNADDLKSQAIDALRNFDASTAEYPEIKALVKALELETPTQKQSDLLAALEVAKANVQTQA